MGRAWGGKLERLEWDARQLRRRGCPLCEGIEERWLLSERGLDIVCCQRCGHVYVNPCPTEEELKAFYQHYFPPESSALWAEQMLGVFRREGVDWLRRRRVRPGRVLDVGCGYGFFLRQLKDRGWQALGVEPAREPARYAREVLGLEVRTGALEEVPLLAEGVDVVTLWYVLEHLADPLRVLRQVAALLRAGGLLIVRVPNANVRIDRTLAKLGGWTEPLFLINPPRHLNDFTAATLAFAFKCAGIRVLEVRNSWPRRTGAAWELLRRWGWYWGAELLRVFLGRGVLVGSSITAYGVKSDAT